MSNLPNEELKKEFANLYDGMIAGEYGGERETALNIMVNIAQAYGDTRELEGRIAEQSLFKVYKIEDMNAVKIIGKLQLRRIEALKDKTHE